MHSCKHGHFQAGAPDFHAQEYKIAIVDMVYSLTETLSRLVAHGPG